MAPRVLATMVTTTSYGSWLPGDARGYVDNGRILPGDPGRLEHARSLLSGSPVFFSDSQQDTLFDGLCHAAEGPCHDGHHDQLRLGARAGLRFTLGGLDNGDPRGDLDFGLLTVCAIMG